LTHTVAYSVDKHARIVTNVEWLHGIHHTRLNFNLLHRKISNISAAFSKYSSCGRQCASIRIPV